jgi:hypothetical protein
MGCAPGRSCGAGSITQSFSLYLQKALKEENYLKDKQSSIMKESTLFNKFCSQRYDVTNSDPVSVRIEGLQRNQGLRFATGIMSLDS